MVAVHMRKLYGSSSVQDDSPTRQKSHRLLKTSLERGSHLANVFAESGERKNEDLIKFWKKQPRCTCL